MPVRRLKTIAAVFLILMLAGCAAPLAPVYSPASPTPLRTGGRASVFVAPFKDGRDLSGALSGPRTIGRITATVFDLRSRSLTLSEDPAAYVTSAFASELRSAGFIVAEDESSADYMLTGTLTDFRLDIMERDEVSIGMVLKLIDLKTRGAVWTGRASIKDSRFAGVMGDTRASIASYLASSLSRAISEALPGLTGVIAPAKTAQPVPAVKAASGRLMMTTEPPGAKAYVNGVYQGLTPVTIECAPGVYDVKIKKKGFREIDEKVSVRARETTELPEELERE